MGDVLVYGVGDVLAWVTWVVCLHGWYEWRASVGSVGRVGSVLTWVVCYYYFYCYY